MTINVAVDTGAIAVPVAVDHGVLPYVARAVLFDGSNDYLTRGAGLTGAGDSKMVTVSGWLRSAADTGANREIFAFATEAGGSAARSHVLVLSSDRLIFQFHNSGGTAVLDLRSSGDTFEEADGWVHFMLSADLADTNKRHLYINGASDLNVTTYTDEAMDFTWADFAVGAEPDGSVKWSGDMADIMFWPGVYCDLSDAANRRLFISDIGKPVHPSLAIEALGDPIVALYGDGWPANQGTGGGFTAHGELTASSESPSGEVDIGVMSIAIAVDTAPISIVIGELIPGGPVTGTMDATESGSDIFEAYESLPEVTGTMDADETGSDVAEMAGSVLVSGTLDATESGSDVAEMEGEVEQGLTSVTLFASETGTDSVTWPDDIIAGDVAVLLSGAWVTTDETPAGFTELKEASFTLVGQRRRGIAAYRICDGSEAGTLAGLSGTTASSTILLVFRGNAPVTTVTPSTWNGQATADDPSAQSVLAGGATPPVIVLGFVFQEGTAAFTTESPAFDAKVTHSTTAIAGYTIADVGDTPANQSVDTDDDTNVNILLSGYLELS